jgi:predicted RNA methylase
MGVLAGETAYHASWGTDTDVVIEANPVDPRWGAGHKRADYAAALKAVEAERAVYFWETLLERGNVAPLGFDSEAYPVITGDDAGTKLEATVGPGSTSWQWGHGTLRALVEDVAARHGYRVYVVLARRAASY